MKLSKNLYMSGKTYFNLLKIWSEKGSVSVKAKHDYSTCGVKLSDGTIVAVDDEPLPRDAVGMTYADNFPFGNIIGLGKVYARVELANVKFNANFSRTLHISGIDIEVEGSSSEYVDKVMRALIKKYFHHRIIYDG